MLVDLVFYSCNPFFLFFLVSSNSSTFCFSFLLNLILVWISSVFHVGTASSPKLNSTLLFQEVASLFYKMAISYLKQHCNKTSISHFRMSASQSLAVTLTLPTPAQQLSARPMASKKKIMTWHSLYSLKCPHVARG